MSLLSPSLRTPLGSSTPRWQSAAVSLRANSLAGWWLRCAIPSRQLLTDGGRAPVSTMVSKMSARPDPPVSPARWENSDQTPSGHTCCYLEDTKLTCVDRFMSRQLKLDSAIKYIGCNQKVPRRRFFAIIFIIGITTEERFCKTLHKVIFDDTPNPFTSIPVKSVLVLPRVWMYLSENCRTFECEKIFRVFA